MTLRSTVRRYKTHQSFFLVKCNKQDENDTSSGEHTTRTTIINEMKGKMKMTRKT